MKKNFGKILPKLWNFFRGTCI